jgi:serine/threonine protein phosphatase PrpC
VGRRRSQNQDSFAFHPELGLFVVADGMGGHKGGEIASAITVEIMPQEIRKSQQYPHWDPQEAIIRAIRAANDAIYDHAQQNPMLRGMGTTVTALLFHGDRLVIGHVGDSRCYFFRPLAAEQNEDSFPVWQATRDHSLVQEKFRAGLITRAEMRTDRMKNVITRSVGFEKNLRDEDFSGRYVPDLLGRALGSDERSRYPQGRGRKTPRGSRPPGDGQDTHRDRQSKWRRRQHHLAGGRSSHLMKNPGQEFKRL